MFIRINNINLYQSSIKEMFFGKIITSAMSYTLNANQYEGQVLSVTNCILDPSSQGPGSLYLKHQNNNPETLLLKLTKAQPHGNLNLYFAIHEEIVTFIVKGKAILHLTGFYQTDSIENKSMQLIRSYTEELNDRQLQKQKQQQNKGINSQVNILNHPNQDESDEQSSQQDDFLDINDDDQEGIDDDITINTKNKINQNNNFPKIFKNNQKKIKCNKKRIKQ